MLLLKHEPAVMHSEVLGGLSENLMPVTALVARALERLKSVTGHFLKR